MSNEIVFDTDSGSIKNFTPLNTQKKDDILVFDTKNVLKEQPVIKQYVPSFELVPEDDPILREVMPEFDFSNPPVNPNEFASSLVETCRKHNGMGLSANQCGFRHRVFVMGSGDNFIACFNPTIVAQSEETSHMIEGCLSFPLLPLRITRSSGVVVDYQDFNGEHHQANFVGISARCFLHELDHMNGIVYTDKVKPLALQQGMKKRQKLSGIIKKTQKKLGNKLHGNTNRVR